MLINKPNDLHRDPNLLRGNKVHVTDAPDWVSKRKVKNSQRIDGYPVTLLLFDRQILPEKFTRYTRYVRRLETPQAVQDAGKVELDFDPSTQSLLIHAVSIFREGKLTNLAKLEDVELIQQERDLQRGIYSGQITALILPKDVRTGDVIDIEWSILSDDTIFPDHYWFAENFEHTLPVINQYFSWMSNDHDKYTLESTAEHASVESEETEWGVRKTWHAMNADRVDPEPALPVGMNPFKCISLSDYSSWHEVASDIADLWSEKSVPGEDLLKELSDLNRTYSEKNEQLIEACVSFVRDNIRYQGVEIGRLGLVPEKLSEIWNRRFGDCKEKTSLLCWMLRECGFDVYPALVSTALQGYVAEQLPAPIFDHVVVYLSYQGVNYWIDPTNISQRGSLNDWKSLPFKKALLISGDTIDFIDIAEPEPGQDKMKVTENYDFSLGSTAMIDVVHEYFGAEADSVRNALDSMGRNSVEKIFVDIFMFSKDFICHS